MKKEVEVEVLVGIEYYYILLSSSIVVGWRKGSSSSLSIRLYFWSDAKAVALRKCSKSYYCDLIYIGTD